MHSINYLPKQTVKRSPNLTIAQAFALRDRLPRLCWADTMLLLTAWLGLGFLLL